MQQSVDALVQMCRRMDARLACSWLLRATTSAALASSAAHASCSWAFAACTSSLRFSTSCWACGCGGGELPQPLSDAYPAHVMCAVASVLRQHCHNNAVAVVFGFGLTPNYHECITDDGAVAVLTHRHVRGRPGHLMLRSLRHACFRAAPCSQKLQKKSKSSA